MCHRLLADARLFAFLRDCDEDLAAQARAQRCLACGGVLHSARYPRKPRGGPAGRPPEHDQRLSFCCEQDGCRKRVTPPSLLFLGRRVYVGAVVVLVSALRHSATPAKMAQVQALVGASARTVARWRRWWREAFATSAFWKAAAGRLRRRVSVERMPQSLLECFAGDERGQLLSALRFLTPITTSSAELTMAR